MSQLTTLMITRALESTPQSAKHPAIVSVGSDSSIRECDKNTGA